MSFQVEYLKELLDRIKKVVGRKLNKEEFNSLLNSTRVFFSNYNMSMSFVPESKKIVKDFIIEYFGSML